MPIVTREWRVVFRVFDDRVEIRIPGFYPRDEVIEIAERALKEDGWLKQIGTSTAGFIPGATVSVTRVLRV